LTYLFSQNQILIFSGSGDHDIRIWKLKDEKSSSFECVEIIKHHEFEVRSLAVEKKNNFLFSGGYDYSIVQWKIHSQKEEKTVKLELIRQFKTQGPTYGLLTFIPNQECRKFWLFCCGWSREINAIEIGNNSNEENNVQTMRGIEGHQSLVTCMTIDSESQQLYSGSMDGVLKRWNVKISEEQFSFDCDVEPKFECAVNSLIFLNELKLVCAANDNGILRFWKIDEKNLKHSFDISLKNNQTIRSLLICPGKQQSTTMLCGLEQ